MARMFSRKKGKSGSTGPSVNKIPSWVKYSAKETELLVVKYAKEGKTPSQIGLFLRDEYGIPDVKLITKKSITQILDEKKLTKKLPEDLTALLKKVLAIQEHLAQNHKDQPARRGLTLTESKILSLIRYYKKVDRLPKDWNYNPKQIKMFIE
ncbi:30S ribosomal protein S15 [Candidatus Woesearchaeota archaeon]|nr:30S ribosomal protein S15 [Candidatus Woesearchaeota archaeon]